MAVMGKPTGDPQIDALSQQIYNLPAVQQAIDAWDPTTTYGGHSTQETQTTIAAAIKAAGLTVPDGYGFEIVPQGGGQTAAGISKTPSPWQAVAPGIYITGALLGGGLLAGGGDAAAGADAATTGGDAAAGGDLASTQIGTGYLPAITGSSGAGAAGGSAAAGSGGSSFLNTVGKIGTVASGAAAGAANGRATEAQITNGYNNSQVGAANANLAQQKFLASVPSEYASQAARGGLQANAQDASITGLPSYVHVPTIAGGLRPSALGPTSQAAGAQLSKEALLKLLNPQAYQPVSLTPPPNASPAATGLGYLGTIASLAGAFGGK